MSRFHPLHFLKKRLEAHLPHGSLRARFAKGAMWSLTGVAISQALALAASVLVVRILGKSLYGEFGMIRSTVVMFGVFAGLGLGLLATKHVAEFRRADPDRTGRIIGLSLIAAILSGGAVAVVMLLVSSRLAAFLAENAAQVARLTKGLRIGVLLLFLEAFDGALIGSLAGLESFKAIAKVKLCRGLLNFPIMVGAVYFWGLWGAVAGLVGVVGCAAVIDFSMVLRESKRAGITVHLRGVSEELPLIWTFAVPASLSGLMYGPAVWAANAFLARQPEGYADLGVFNAANNLRRLVVMAGVPVGSVLLPLLSSQAGRRSELFQRANVLITWMMGLLIAVPVIAFPDLIGVMFGKEIAGPAFNYTLVLLIFSAAIMAYKDGMARVLAARNLMWYGFLSNALWGAILVGSMVVGRYYGSTGMAVAYVLAYGLGSMVFIPFYIRRNLVARELVWSADVLCMWLALASGVAMNFFHPPVMVRVVAAILLLVIIGHFARRLIRRNWVSSATA